MSRSDREELVTALLITLVVIVVAFILSGCSHRRPSTEPVLPDTLGGILRIIGKMPIAHACPVAPDWALTNAHVADNPRPPMLWHEEGSVLPVRWSDRQGNEGLAIAVAIPYADLAGLRPVGRTFAQWYQPVTEPPKPGTHVRFIGYDFSSKRDAFTEQAFSTSISRVIAGHVIYLRAGEPGTSGSCVLDDQDRVVAINAWGKTVGLSDEVGVGVGVWPIPGLSQLAPSPLPPKE